MAKIICVTIYPFINGITVDIMYESGRLYTKTLAEVPKTVRAWIVDKNATEHFDKNHNRWVTQYK